MATLEARSVVGLAGTETSGRRAETNARDGAETSGRRAETIAGDGAQTSGGGGDEEDPILDKEDGERIFRITAIKNRFS